MSDDTETTDTAGAPKPRPTPASRARRIGGRPTPSAAPKPTPRPAPVEDTAAAPESTKPTPPRREPKPAPAKPVAVTKAVTKAVTEGVATADPKPDRTTTDPTTDSTAPKRGGRALPLRWLPANLLGLAALVLAVLVAIASHGVYWAKSDDAAGAVTKNQEQVLAAAKQCFHVVTSYDYRKLTDLVATDTACTTGTFRTQLTKSLKTQIIPNAPKVKAVQSAQVNRAGIVSVSATGDQMVVLIYAQLSLSNNTTAKDSRVDVLGAIATVDKVDGKWLISNLDTDVGNTLGG